MNIYSKFYLLESGEILDRASAYRSAHIDRQRALEEVARGFGAARLRVCPLSLKLNGIGFDGDPPPGFRRPDTRGMSRPYKRNVEAQAHFVQDGPVEWFSPFREFCDWLGCPTRYAYSKAAGNKGWTLIGFPLRPIQICWYSEDGPIMLMVPDVEQYAQEAEAEGRVVDDDGLSWRMHPRHPGAREILIEEWRLMAAQPAREVVADHA